MNTEYIFIAIYAIAFILGNGLIYAGVYMFTKGRHKDDELSRRQLKEIFSSVMPGRDDFKLKVAKEVNMVAIFVFSALYFHMFALAATIAVGAVVCFAIFKMELNQLRRAGL